MFTVASITPIHVPLPSVSMAKVSHLFRGPVARGADAYSTPGERLRGRPRRLLLYLALVLGAWVFTLLDRPIWLAVTTEGLRYKDWWQALRVGGFLPAWFVIAHCFHMHDRARGVARPLHRATLIFLAAALGGLAAEIVREVSRRQRPGAEGIYTFDWFGMGREGLGIGLASSHAGVAFGGFIMLSWLLPHLRWQFLLLACGCAWTRIQSGAHWTTDVYVAVLLSYGVCWLLWKHLGPGSAFALPDPHASR